MYVTFISIIRTFMIIMNMYYQIRTLYLIVLCDFYFRYMLCVTIVCFVLAYACFFFFWDVSEVETR